MKTSSVVGIWAMLAFWSASIVIGGQREQRMQSQQEPLTTQETIHYEMLARSWASRLWATNDCYCVVQGALGAIPSWTYEGSWSKMFEQSELIIQPDEIHESQPWRKRVIARFSITVSNTTYSSTITFADRKSDKIQYIHNGFYVARNVPYRKGGTPFHSTEQQARTKAAEYATTLGLSNLWDKTRFMLRSPSFTDGVWTYSFTPNVNGYPTLYAISISIADLPGLPLGRWFNDMDQIPANLPTNVVLTAEQARKKAETYLKQYFPMKEIVPKMTFITNSLEYMTPNYNYIRPADETGFSKYIPPKDSIALVWKNYFKRPSGLSFSSFPVIIDVDAATGEMLGGSD